LDTIDIATMGSLYRIIHRPVDITDVDGGCNHGEDTTGWNGVTRPHAAPQRNPLQNPKTPSDTQKAGVIVMIIGDGGDGADGGIGGGSWAAIFCPFTFHDIFLYFSPLSIIFLLLESTRYIYVTSQIESCIRIWMAVACSRSLLNLDD